MAMIDNDWLPCIQDEFKKPYYKELYRFIRQEYNTRVVYPPADDIFNAFHLTPLGIGTGSLSWPSSGSRALFFGAA